MRNGLIRLLDTEDENDFQVEFILQEGEEWRTVTSESCRLPPDLDEYPELKGLAGDSVVDMIVTHVNDSRESRKFDAIGQLLHDLVFKEKISERWQEAVRDTDGLRTYLLIEQPQLRPLPWELMCNKDDYDLARIETAPILRIDRLPGDDWSDIDVLPLPIRILVVVGQDDTNDDDIGAMTEVRAIKEGLAKTGGRFEAQFLIAPNWQDVKITYQKLLPHVLHFIGHAVTHDGKPELQLIPAGAQTKDDGITVKDIRELRPAPRLAILNACRPASSREHRSLAEAFLVTSPFDSGTLAVIGMQGDITGRAAALFASSLYSNMAKLATLDVAVTRARDAVHTEAGGRSGHRDWFLPTLTVRKPVERVLTAPLPVPEKEVLELEAKLTPNITRFVDRENERFEVTNQLIPLLSDQHTKVLVVQGESRTGKSLLVHWTRRWCALRRHRVKYVDLKGKYTHGLVETLKAITTTPDDIESIAPLADIGLKEFTLRLPRFAELLDQQNKMSPEILHQMFEEFIATMRRSTTEVPLVVILDHIENVEPGVLHDILCPMLIEKALSGALPNVRLVIVVDTRDRGYPKIQPSISAANSVEVSPFGADDFANLTEDALHKIGVRLNAKTEQIVALSHELIKNPWLPEVLICITDSLDAIGRNAS